MFEYLANFAFVYYAPFYLDVLSVLYIVEFNLLNFYISFDEGYLSMVFSFGNVFVWVQ